MKTTTRKINIYIAGDLVAIEATCRRFTLCGLCVTVTPTKYIFTGGAEGGAIVGLINYPRFPAKPEELTTKAHSLASALMDACCQRSCTIETPETSEYIENSNIAIPR